jgi:hypothetical protein
MGLHWWKSQLLLGCSTIAAKGIKESFQTKETLNEPADIGAEQSLKYYSNKCNIMEEILFSHYDLFISQEMLTHITTRLSGSEIENFYGSRSRVREMFI